MNETPNWIDFLKKLGEKLTAPLAFVVILVVVFALLGDRIPADFRNPVIFLVFAGLVVDAILQAVRLWPKPDPDRMQPPRIEPISEKGLSDEVIKKYLKWVSTKYGKIDLKGIKRADEQVVRLDLEEIYVPLEADVIRAEREQKDPQQAEQNSSISMTDVCHKGDRLVVTGGPGSGKSTVLYYIAFWLAKAIFDNQPEMAKQKIGIERPLPIPVVVPLGEFNEHRKKSKTESDPEKSTLWYFISCYLTKLHKTDLPDDFFAQIIRANRPVILLLDGLDEVPTEDDREEVASVIENLALSQPDLRIVVTCRSVAYKGPSALAGFREIRVRPLTPGHIASLIGKAYQFIHKNDADEARRKADDLIAGVQKLETDRRSRLGEVEPLVTNPLMVRMLLIVHHSNQQLPEQRAELFLKVTDSLLEPEHSLDESVKDILGKTVGGSREFHRDMLEWLAFAMHSQGEEQGKLINEHDLKAVLSKEERFRPHIEDLVAFTRARGSVLKAEGEIFSFIHLGFQEYLAGRYLAEVIRSQNGIEGIAVFMEAGPVMQSWWREAALLTIGYLSLNASYAAENLVKRLAGLDDKVSQRRIKPRMHLAAIELAASGLLEFQTPNLSLQKTIRDRLAEKWIQKVDLAVIPALERARAGSTLARLGDPRFDPDLFYLPGEDLLGFVAVPPGKFWMGSDKQKDKDAYENEIPQHEVDLPLYYLHRYPVTVAQFKAYVEADEKHAPGYPFSLRGAANHPVVGITWYEALGYCRWLNRALRENPRTPPPLQKLLEQGWEVTLPGEAEWEKGARGPDGRLYPWQGAFDPQIANTFEARIGGTSPVGCFPAGASPYELQDMAGNVVE